jgi:hypothetical protein
LVLLHLLGHFARRFKPLEQLIDVAHFEPAPAGNPLAATGV